MFNTNNTSIDQKHFEYVECKYEDVPDQCMVFALREAGLLNITVKSLDAEIISSFNAYENAIKHSSVPVLRTKTMQEFGVPGRSWAHDVVQSAISKVYGQDILIKNRSPKFWNDQKSRQSVLLLEVKLDLKVWHCL